MGWVAVAVVGQSHIALNKKNNIQIHVFQGQGTKRIGWRHRLIGEVLLLLDTALF